MSIVMTFVGEGAAYGALGVPYVSGFHDPRVSARTISQENGSEEASRSALPVVRHTLMYLRRRNPVSSATRASLPTHKGVDGAQAGQCAIHLRPGAQCAAELVLEDALATGGFEPVIVVWKLDRLGRSLRNLLEIAEKLHERGVALRSLTEHIDSATAAGKMLYSVLGAVAQFERDVLHERTVAGIRAAQARGEHVGRPRAPIASQVREARARCSTAVRTPRMSRALCAWDARRSIGR